MFKNIFLIVVVLNILIFSITISFKIINKLNHNNEGSIKNNNSMRNESVQDDIDNLDTLLNYPIPIIDAIALIPEYDYYLIKDSLSQWENKVDLYNNKKNEYQVQYLVLVFTNKNVQKFLKELNLLGFKAKLIDGNITLGLFTREDQAQILKQKAIAKGLDVGIMKRSSISNLNYLDELHSKTKYIVYFDNIDYSDFFEINKILGSFAVVEPVFLH